jgi:hypothetical protein
VLLPAPTLGQADRWRRRPLQLHDTPPPDDHQPTDDEPPTDHKNSNRIADHEQKLDADPITDPFAERQRDPQPDPAPPVQPPSTTPAPIPWSEQPPEPSGMGRGGTPVPNPFASRYAHQEPRLPEAPDVYHRRSRLPDPPAYISAEPPPFTWPAGSVPATPPAQEGQP